MTQEVIFWLALAVLAFLFGLGALQFGPVARLAPLLVSVAALALVVMQLALRLSPRMARYLWWAEVGDVFRISERAEGEDQDRKETAGTPGARGDARDSLLRKELQMTGWVAALVLGTWLIGLYAAVAGFLLVFLRRVQGEPWRVAVATALVMTVGMWLIFDRFFGVRLYPGVLVSAGVLPWVTVR